MLLPIHLLPRASKVLGTALARRGEESGLILLQGYKP